MSLIDYLSIDRERCFKNVVTEITIYETFDGSRFDSLHEANNYEERLKNQAIRSLCNYDYDEWEDYMFNLSKETAKRGFHCSTAQQNQKLRRKYHNLLLDPTLTCISS